MNTITKQLNTFFSQHRLVFWYDEDQEFGQDFEEFELASVEKCVVKNNEFGIKVKILHKQPKQKFLLYFPTSCPEPRNNWLLDLLLCHAELRTNPVDLVLHELEMGREYASLIESHLGFFKSSERKEKLKVLVDTQDSESKLRMKLMAVIGSCAPDLESLLFQLFRELCADLKNNQGTLGLESLSGKIGENISKFGLGAFFWEQVERHYDYHSEQPTLMDFLLQLMSFSIAALVDNPPQLSAEARTLINHWKDSYQHREIYDQLSKIVASENYLNLKNNLQKVHSVETLLELDGFTEIDQRILFEIKHEFAALKPPLELLERWIDSRKNSHWYEEYKTSYNAFHEVIKLFFLLDKLDLKIDSFEEGLEKYTQSFYKLDLHYRRFMTFSDQSGFTDLFGDIEKKVEQFYVNRILSVLNEQWQEQIEKHPWQSEYVIPQQNFFEKLVRPLLQKKGKVFVLISDALRYECAVELKEMVLRENRFHAELLPMLGVLPSYTQLGMAALLPNKKLEMDKKAEKVLVDEQSSQGLEGRQKILQAEFGKKAKAMHLKNFMKLNQEQGRLLTREHDVIYLYHNRIDKTGDDPNTEHLVFNAVQETQLELIQALKKIAAFNGNNVLLTADHGFIYQKLELDEADFIEVDSAAAGIGKLSRRFIVGQNMDKNPSLWNITASSVGLEGQTELQFPRSINRLRKKGSGKQFVHGGAALQEIVIPCLSIKKLRVSDVSKVEVSVLGQTSVITTNQVTISFYQEEPVNEKVQGRTIKVGFFKKTGELISDLYEINFDSAQTESTLREVKRTFNFTRSSENNLECLLKLTSKIEGANQFSPYKEANYLLRKTFVADF